MYMLTLFSILVAAVAGRVDFWNDPCYLWPQGYIPVVEETVPETCDKGHFQWSYPRGFFELHFPNPSSVGKAVCLSNFIATRGVFIYDKTEGPYKPMSVADGRLHTPSGAAKETCTPHYRSNITLHFSAKNGGGYMAGVDYRLQT